MIIIRDVWSEEDVCRLHLEDDESIRRLKQQG
jgi:hypothetical protein